MNPMYRTPRTHVERHIRSISIKINIHGMREELYVMMERLVETQGKTPLDEVKLSEIYNLIEQAVAISKGVNTI